LKWWLASPPLVSHRATQRLRENALGMMDVGSVGPLVTQPNGPTTATAGLNAAPNLPWQFSRRQPILSGAWGAWSPSYRWAHATAAGVNLCYGSKDIKHQIKGLETNAAKISLIEDNPPPSAIVPALTAIVPSISGAQSFCRVGRRQFAPTFPAFRYAAPRSICFGRGP
jgi:hypothetical protein